MTLADLIRRGVGRATVGRSISTRRPARRADPALIAAVARVSNNLNQIARWVNLNKSAASATQVITELIAIENDVALLRPYHSRAPSAPTEVTLDG